MADLGCQDLQYLQQCVNITSICRGICTQHWLANEAVGARLGYPDQNEYRTEYKPEAEFYHGWDRMWGIGSTKVLPFSGQGTHRRAT
jgi:hypothetical protein